ncbi:MAG: hypothetical protein HY747_06035 [Elusimicrobia bacterium]|nr:hypothetical protein [Elusimicrobiota bacterium]
MRLGRQHRIEVGAVTGEGRRGRCDERCTECNRPLKKIPKSKIDPKKIPPKVFEFQQEFYFCEKCRKIFWSGSHVDKTMARLKEIGIPVNL